MALELFAHPLSSYCWKALIALWEKGTPFTYRHIDNGHPDEAANAAALMAHWPLGKFPLLVDGDVVLPESSVIIEYLETHDSGGTTLLPRDPAQRLEVRLYDRIFDNHVMLPVQRIVGDALKPPERRDPEEVEQVKASLDTVYAWLDRRMAGREWAAGDAFSLADCAAAPALFYADWTHRLEAHTHLAAYRARLLARPSVQRAVDEARPFRQFFPLGAPDRD